MSHIYALITIAVALNDSQRAQINQAMQDLGPNTDTNPANDVHWRWRADGQALIVEAAFVSNPTKAQVVNAIANRTGLSNTIVNNNLTISILGNNADRELSRQGAVGYLQTNAAQWGE